jgi:hypothetical protein
MFQNHSRLLSYMCIQTQNKYWPPDTYQVHIFHIPPRNAMAKLNTVYFFQILHETTASIRINGSNSMFDCLRNSRRRIACAGCWSGSQIRWDAWLHQGGVHSLNTENNFLREKKIAVSIQANVLTRPSVVLAGNDGGH